MKHVVLTLCFLQCGDANYSGPSALMETPPEAEAAEAPPKSAPQAQKRENFRSLLLKYMILLLPESGEDALSEAMHALLTLLMVMIVAAVINSPKRRKGKASRENPKRAVAASAPRRRPQAAAASAASASSSAASRAAAELLSPRAESAEGGGDGAAAPGPGGEDESDMLAPVDREAGDVGFAGLPSPECSPRALPSAGAASSTSRGGEPPGISAPHAEERTADIALNNAVVEAVVRRGGSFTDDSAATVSCSALVELVTAETKMIATAVRLGRSAELPRLLQRARETCAAGAGSVVEIVEAQHLLCALRACAARRQFRHALAAYDSANQRGSILDRSDICSSIWSLLFYISLEAAEYHRCKVFLCRLCDSKATISGKDFVNVVRYYLHLRDVRGLKFRLKELRHRLFAVDVASRKAAFFECMKANFFEAASTVAEDSISPWAVSAGITVATCSLMLKALLNSSQFLVCLTLYDRIIPAGLEPDASSFCLAISAAIAVSSSLKAFSVFQDMCRCQFVLPSNQFIAYSQALVLDGKAAHAIRSLEDFRTVVTIRDPAVYSTLVKVCSEAGFVGEAVEVLAMMREDGLAVGNTLYYAVLTSCIQKTGTFDKALELIPMLMSRGLVPHGSMLSHMLQTLIKMGSLKQAVQLLKVFSHTFQLRAEGRSYVIVMQALAKARQGEEAVRLYRSVVDEVRAGNAKVTESNNSRLLHACVQAKEGLRAAEIYCDLQRLVKEQSTAPADVPEAAAEEEADAEPDNTKQ